MPAYCGSHAMSAPAASRRRTVALLMDGPIPSPEIRVTGVGISMDRKRWSTDGDQVGEVARHAREQRARERRRRIAHGLARPADVANARVDQDGAEDGNSLTRFVLVEPQLDGQQHRA